MVIKKHRVLYTLVFAIIGIAIWSCSDKNEWPDEPVINDLRFDVAERKMFIDFTDGDGNFGHDAGDPDFPQYLDPDSLEENPYYYNLWVDYFEMRQGEWVLVEPNNTFNFIIPDLTPQGQTKQLEVTATYDMSFDIPYLLAESDSIKFRVVLVDRDQNRSLPEETELIVFGE